MVQTSSDVDHCIQLLHWATECHEGSAQFNRTHLLQWIIGSVVQQFSGSLVQQLEDHWHHWFSSSLDQLVQWMVQQVQEVHWITHYQWISGSAVHWITGSVDQRFTGSVVQQFTGSLYRWFSSSLDHWFSGSNKVVTLVSIPGSAVHWFILVQQFTGSVVHCITGSLVQQFTGSLVQC